MISPHRSCTVLLLSFLAAVPAVAATPQEQAVEALGVLNGTALHCHYMDEVRRIKSVVVAHAPRTRPMGAVFETATNESYLAFSQEQRACPPPDDFTREVDAAIEALQAASAPGERTN
ncbi:MAG: hypothetical protein WC383_08940 [Gammaproteobacteria bacterium]